MEDLFEDVLQMIIRGLEVVCMVLWYYAAYNFTHQDVIDPLVKVPSMDPLAR